VTSGLGGGRPQHFRYGQVATKLRDGLDFASGQAQASNVPRGTGHQGDASASPAAVLTYTNRMGEVYHLHEGRTKTGKVRYFVAKTIRQGALAAMPAGFKFCESVNAVVSVRKINPLAPRIPRADLTLARAEMAQYGHLRAHRVEEVKGEIVVFEPTGGMPAAVIAELRLGSWMHPEHLSDRVGARRPRLRYFPVMKFVPSAKSGIYGVHRMTYRGDGGWSWLLASDTLPKLLRQYVRHVGTDEFFELV
jgi:hypothetical protein